MKICLNTKFIEGPFGGGMQFANFFYKKLKEKGFEVVNNLKDSDIDVIFHINPFPFLMESSSFSFLDAYVYKLKNPKTIIIQRVNECDERKNTNYINNLLYKTVKYSDHIIYIASWLEKLFSDKYKIMKDKSAGVVLNGADNNIFNFKNKDFWNDGKKIKIVTHHWGADYNKGHFIYKKLDDLLNLDEFKNNFEFTFIGNIPKNIEYKNIKIIKPLSGNRLADELKKHDIYLTASLNEPAGMHHIEGALCGLPLLYINSGALPEYCNNFGLEFNNDNFEKKLLEMKNNYNFWLEKIKNYNNTAEKMVDNYIKKILELKNKQKNIKRRKFFLSFIYRIYSKIYNFVWFFKKRYVK
ncbi:MAG: glycosyltransferase [Patescibacteria group bacterium]